MKGTIVSVRKTGNFGEMVINEVTFKHGESLKFFTKKTAKNPNGDISVPLRISEDEVVGHTFEYELSPTGNGQIKKVEGGNTTFAPKNPVAQSHSTNDSILLQVCYKENMQAYGKDFGDEVLTNTVEHFKFLRNFLNNL